MLFFYLQQLKQLEEALATIQPTARTGFENRSEK